jgi:hypothetical protein
LPDKGAVRTTEIIQLLIIWLPFQFALCRYRTFFAADVALFEEFFLPLCCTFSLSLLISQQSFQRSVYFDKNVPVIISLLVFIFLGMF